MIEMMESQRLQWECALVWHCCIKITLKRNSLNHSTLLTILCFRNLAVLSLIMWCVREKERLINLWIIAASHVLSFAQEVLYVFYLTHLILTTTFWGGYDYYHSYFIAEEVETWRSDIWARPQIWEVEGQGTYAGRSGCGCHVHNYYSILPFWLCAEGALLPARFLFPLQCILFSPFSDIWPQFLPQLIRTIFKLVLQWEGDDQSPSLLCKFIGLFYRL